jgi:hypothetical protein
VFKKGQSGNPAGRKPGISNKPTVLREIIGKLMEEERKVEMTEGGKKRFVNMTTCEALVRSTLSMAMRGDAAARNFIADRWVGRAVQPIDFGNTGGEGIKIIIEGVHGGNGNGNGNGKGDGVRLIDDIGDCLKDGI